MNDCAENCTISYNFADLSNFVDEGNGQINPIEKVVDNYLWNMSNLFSISEKMDKINNTWLEYYKGLFKNENFKNILIIGSGFGILPILALMEGRNIYFCESYPLLARLAEGNIYKYHLQNNLEITSIHGLYKEPIKIEYPADIPHKCDLVVLDDFDHTLLETGVMDILTHLKQTVLEENAVIVPAQIKVYMMAIEYKINNDYFDMSSLGEYQWAVGLKPFDPQGLKYRKLSEAEEVCELDFRNAFADLNREIHIKITDEGNFNYILVWYELFGEKYYSIQYVETTHVKKNDICEVTAAVSKDKIRFQMKNKNYAEKTKLISSWYIDMLDDCERNEKYKEAITQVCQNKNIKSVLDIGSGFGFLSMMIRKIRPDIKIYSCENLKQIAEIAKTLVDKNGFGDQIEVINQDILKLELAPVDLVVFEMFDCGLIGEGILHFVDYCRKNLLKKDGIFLPKKAALHAMIVEERTQNKDNIDLSLLNPYRWKPDYSSIDINRTNYKKLSEPFEVCSIEFDSYQLKPEVKEMDVSVIQDGIAGAVVFWFELSLTDDVKLSTSPFSGSSNHWKQAIQYIQELNVVQGNILPLIIKNSSTKFDFSVNIQKLDEKITVSKTPRFDPNWFKKLHEAEYNFQQFLSQSKQNKKDYQSVVLASLKIASMPGKYHILPKYACRMAESFFLL